MGICHKTVKYSFSLELSLSKKNNLATHIINQYTFLSLFNLIASFLFSNTHLDLYMTRQFVVFGRNAPHGFATPKWRSYIHSPVTWRKKVLIHTPC